jgi:hypothetical protein
MCIFKTSTILRKKKWCALKKIYEERACHPNGDHGYMKMCQRRSSHIVVYAFMGEQSARLHQASTIKKGVPS